MRPRCLVCWASAGSSVSGSNEGDGGRALQRLHRHVQHGQVIGHEEGVELAALQCLRVLDQRLEIEVGVRRAARIAPGGGMDAHRAHEGAEAELAFLGHGKHLRAGQGLARGAEREELIRRIRA